jgi:hypothetical protein
MSFKLKSTRNNPNPIEFKKETKQEQSENEIEIIEVTTNGHFNNNIQIPSKKEHTDNNNNERINQLELENNTFKSKINDLNEIIHAKSDEIIDLLKQQQRNGSSQLNVNINKLELENKSLINENDQLKFKINDLNNLLQVKTSEIIDLKFKLNKYEQKFDLKLNTSETEDEASQNNQSEETILNLEPESTYYNMSTHESEFDSDQSYDDETYNKVIIYT